jgi:hypothetical protein
MSADSQVDQTVLEAEDSELSGCVKCGDPFHLEASCQKKPVCRYCDSTSHEMEDCPNTTRCGYCQLGGHEEDEGCPHAGEGEDRITEKPVTEREQRVKAAERYKNRNVPKNGEGAQSEHYGNGAQDRHPVNGSQPDHHGNGNCAFSGKL